MKLYRSECLHVSRRRESKIMIIHPWEDYFGAFMKAFDMMYSRADTEMVTGLRLEEVWP